MEFPIIWLVLHRRLCIRSRQDGRWNPCKNAQPSRNWQENMFQAPTTIETTVFAKLPEKYHQTGRQTEWLKLQRRGENLNSLLEGPSFDREGNLYVVDVPSAAFFVSRRKASSI